MLCQAKLKEDGLNEKRTVKIEEKIAEAQDRISNLNTSKADIDVLAADQNIYAFSSVSGSMHGVRQGDDNKV